MKNPRNAHAFQGARDVSAETLLSLTGFGLPAAAEQCRRDFLAFIRESERAFPDWIDAWDAFAATRDDFSPR